MHSRCSDGSLSVPDLVEAVRAAGVHVFALTDHDTVQGMDAAAEQARRLGLEHVTGIEISTRIEQVELHILGYGFDPTHRGLVAALAGQAARRRERIPRILAKLSSLGATLSLEDVEAAAGDAVPGRPHVARALVERGYARDHSDAFQRFLGDGQPGHVRKTVPPPSEAIGWIHAAGGRAVWAHPLARPIQRPGGFERLLRELRHEGLDGVEEIHPAQTPTARARIRKLARELKLSTTGGSDFHGGASPGVAIGSGRGRDSVPASVVDRLFG